MRHLVPGLYQEPELGGGGKNLKGEKSERQENEFSIQRFNKTGTLGVRERRFTTRDSVVTQYLRSSADCTRSRVGPYRRSLGTDW